MRPTRRILSGDFSLDAVVREVSAMSPRTDKFKEDLGKLYAATYKTQFAEYCKESKTAWEEMKAANAAQKDAYEACLAAASGQKTNI